MTKAETKARIAELAKLEAEAIAEGDHVMFRHFRGIRNYLESRL